MFTEKYKPILPADVYVTEAQRTAVIADRRNGIPHPEITSIRLTGNNFMDLFASLVEGGGGLMVKNLAKRMGVKPRLITPAIEAMTGLPAHEWVKRYLHLSACDKLRNGYHRVSDIAHMLGFRSVSSFSHFFYRLEHCHPKKYRTTN
ncbi:MAG: helix-turn-helix domain-containing protein [Prevotellaceae bacterium]|jgi:AraC-like DNA-binding protein|nr:helix-turn-helix domain-containing protein [Prevotellaceae bacterium]